MNNVITFDMVDQSYNGRSGCMCGCIGTYSWPGSRPRAVKMAVTKLNKMFEQYGVPKDASEEMKLRHEHGIDIGIDSECAWFDDGNRNTVVYFK